MFGSGRPSLNRGMRISDCGLKRGRLIFNPYSEILQLGWSVKEKELAPQVSGSRQGAFAEFEVGKTFAGFVQPAPRGNPARGQLAV